ncbi:MAG: PEP-utilizing enzyme [Candidatus Woesearchaeota archaeon]|nr:PEP-utilizing enzyme [Candidatus Woesearchaeota archaeon]
MNKLLAEFANTDWHYWHIRRRPPLLIYFFYYGSATQTAKEFPYPVLTNGQCCSHVVTQKDELTTLGKKAGEQFKKEPTFVLQFMERMREQNKKHQQKWRKLLKIDFSKYANEELRRTYQNYISDLFAHVPTTYFPLCMESILTEECKKRLPHEAYDVVMTPVQESEVIEERKSLLKMAIQKKQKKDITNGLKEHVERFSFLKRKDMFMEFYDDADYLEKIKHCTEPEKELATLEAETERKQKAFQKILETADDFSKLLFKTANEAVFFRSWRTERYSQSTYYIVPLFTEIAKRLKFEIYQDVVWLMPPEVTALLHENKPVDKELINQRKEAFTYLTFGPDQILVLQGKEALESLKHLKLPDVNTTEIKGMPAYRGKVTGKVTLIMNKNEWPRMEKAEVLVIHTTTPDMVPYLKNVKAIVTEEGGILSHASVISRELKIPCVIGTRTATKVLKEGDIVEVDATNGTVKRLKHD